MKNKSKLSRWALMRVMLQALLLLLVAPTSAFAAAEADQEIGVPQAMDSKAKASFCHRTAMAFTPCATGC